MDAQQRQRDARHAEQLVGEYLEARGFEIVARNLRLGPLELDLVARKRELVVVVEVRMRSPRSWTTAHGSVLPAKRQLLRRGAARLWRLRYAKDPTVERLRIDVAAVVPGPFGWEIDYCPAAFT